MKRILYLLFGLGLFCVSPCYAILGVGDIVFDPQAYAQQLIDYMVAIKQYSTQMDQYATQIKQLENMYEHSRSLGYRADLSNLNDIQRVMRESTGISNNYAKMQEQFQTAYPDFAKYQQQRGVDYAAQSVQWSRINQRNAHDMLVLGTKLQDSIAQDQATLNYLSNRSYAASGTKDLLQAMNQLLVLQTKQLFQLQEIMTNSAKAQAAYFAEQSSNDEASRSAGKNLYRDWTKTRPYTPAPEPGHVLQ